MNSAWFSTFHKQANPEIQLFCFPYAGGNASTFAGWHSALPKHVAVLGLQTPGRASRLMEDPIDNMEELSSIVAEKMGSLINRRYVMLGHSLGARLAYEVTLKLTDKGVPAPAAFIASGSPAPSVERSEAPIFHLSEPEFIEAIRQMGGTPEEVFQHAELREIILPALRADFKIVDTYKGSQLKINTCAHIFYGLNDHTVSIEDAKSWKQHFTNDCIFHPIDGDHFFIDNQKKQVLSLVNQILEM